MIFIDFDFEKFKSHMTPGLHKVLVKPMCQVVQRLGQVQSVQKVRSKKQSSHEKGSQPLPQRGEHGRNSVEAGF